MAMMYSRMVDAHNFILKKRMMTTIIVDIIIKNNDDDRDDDDGNDTYNYCYCSNIWHLL